MVRDYIYFLSAHFCYVGQKEFYLTFLSGSFPTSAHQRTPRRLRVVVFHLSPRSALCYQSVEEDGQLAHLPGLCHSVTVCMGLFCTQGL